MMSAAERQLPGCPEPAPWIRPTAIRRISVAHVCKSRIEIPELADPLQHAVDVEAVDPAQLVLRSRLDERARQAEPKHFAREPAIRRERGDRAADPAVDNAFLDRDDARDRRQDFDER